ncbi:MAG: hypothetical protein KDB80_10725 [Planctomycetes bacterium]|nr:hypothetical protein [Planctomycetota bacterium]
MRTTAPGCGGVVAVTLAIIVGLCACAGGPPVDPEALKREEQRLLAPFSRPQTLAADRFEITMTANFFDEFVPHLRSQTQRREHSPRPDGGAVYTFVDEVPGRTPMRFQLGATELWVFERLRLDVLGGRSELTLNASGERVTLHTGDTKQDLGSVEIRDGMFRRVP